MNYYKRHLGDYARDAGHLTMLEHGAFTLLLDRYYATEKPISMDDAMRVCRARSQPDRDVVQTILREFFHETAEGWRNKRADEEIATYNEKADRNRQAGRKGGRPKTVSVISGNPKETQTVSLSKPRTNPSHKPLATSQEQSVPPTAGASPPKDPDPIFGAGLAFLVRKGVTEKGARGFLGLMRKDCGDLLTIELLLKAEKDDVSDPVAWLRAAGKARAGPPNGKRPPVNASFAGKDYSIGATPDDELFDFGPH